MKQLFVTSDIHSYYTPFKKSLDLSGYDKNNPDHVLIVLGDCFDRGKQSREVLNYFEDNERAILIKGNHEDLLEECMYNHHYNLYDIRNGTVDTIMQLGNRVDHLDLKSLTPDNFEYFQNACDIASAKTEKLLNRMINYFETENYIFVHSWIPTNVERSFNPNNKMYQIERHSYNPDWRETPTIDWENARWNNPFKLALEGLNQTGKTIVFGHWHTSWYRSNQAKDKKIEFGSSANFDPVYDDTYKIIGIDACTAYSDQCNVIKLKDNLLFE